MSYHLKWLKDPGFPFRIQHAKACLITRGPTLYEHLMRCVKHSLTIEGSGYWSSVCAWAMVSGDSHLYNIPPNHLPKPIQPHIALARMIITAEYINERNYQIDLDGGTPYTCFFSSEDFTPLGGTQFLIDDPSVFPTAIPSPVLSVPNPFPQIILDDVDTSSSPEV